MTSMTPVSRMHSKALVSSLLSHIPPESALMIDSAEPKVPYSSWPPQKSIKTPPDWRDSETYLNLLNSKSKDSGPMTEKDLESRSASTKSQHFEKEQRRRQEQSNFLQVQNELREKDAKLNQTKTYLDIVERDRETCKQELQAHHVQAAMWEDEMKRRDREEEEMRKKMDHLVFENERLAYENEDLKRRLERTEAKKRQANEEKEKAITQLQSLQRELSKHNGSVAAVKSSFPQLLCHDPLSFSQAPRQRGTVIPERDSPLREPEIRWHPKEEDCEIPSPAKPSSPPARSLAPDQYGPLQAWLQKQNMEAAFSGAYAVTPSSLSPSSTSSPQKSSRSSQDHSKASRYLECPKCESRFDARNFSAYRYHLEDCL